MYNTINYNYNLNFFYYKIIFIKQQNNSKIWFIFLNIIKYNKFNLKFIILAIQLIYYKLIIIIIYLLTKYYIILLLIIVLQVIKLLKYFPYVKKTKIIYFIINYYVLYFYKLNFQWLLYKKHKNNGIIG